MSIRSRVAVLKVKPETVLDDIARTAELGGMKQALDPTSTTILKDNISWHYPFPAANTTPWQLEGTILALRKQGKVRCGVDGARGGSRLPRILRGFWNQGRQTSQPRGDKHSTPRRSVSVSVRTKVKGPAAHVL